MRKRKEKPLPLLTAIETSEANDPCFAAPAAPVSDDVAQDAKRLRLERQIILAMALLKVTGYRVVKLKPKRYRRKGKYKDRVGPTIAVEFADGTTTRMSVFTSLEQLDWNRGLRLSRLAWESRWRARRHTYQSDTIGPVAPIPPAIVTAHFEQDGKLLAQRNYESGRAIETEEIAPA
jgi:hypothetical protein